MTVFADRRVCCSTNGARGASAAEKADLFQCTASRFYRPGK